jgi:hypothetical protein
VKFRLAAIFAALAFIAALPAGAADYTPTELDIISHLKGADRMYLDHAVEHASDGILNIDESNTWKSGDIGRLQTDHVKMRILSKDAVLVRQRKAGRTDLDLNPAVRTEHLFGKTIIISGISTATYTDHSRNLKLPPETVFVCLGDSTYLEPAGASKKTKEIRAVNLDLVRPALGKILALRGQRAWTLDNRSVRGQARAKASRGIVEIVTTDGKTLRAKLHQLSEEDQHWLASGGAL